MPVYTRAHTQPSLDVQGSSNSSDGSSLCRSPSSSRAVPPNLGPSSPSSSPSTFSPASTLPGTCAANPAWAPARTASWCPSPAPQQPPLSALFPHKCCRCTPLPDHKTESWGEVSTHRSWRLSAGSASPVSGAGAQAGLWVRRKGREPEPRPALSQRPLSSIQTGTLLHCPVRLLLVLPPLDPGCLLVFIASPCPHYPLHRGFNVAPQPLNTAGGEKWACLRA